MKFTDIAELAEMSRAGSKWALFLDLDDSLIDLALEPDAVVVPKRLLAALLSIKSTSGGALAIVSDRTVRAIDQILSPGTFDVAGKSGRELRIGKARFCFGLSRSEQIGSAVLRLQRLTHIHSGCLIESKQSGLTVHWRLAPHLEQVVLDHALELASELGWDFRIQRDKRFVELHPVATGKAQAISMMMPHEPYRGRTPIFVGGNFTDEPVLRLVRALGGYSIQVGAALSDADYTLKDATAANSWLLALSRTKNNGSADRLESETRMHAAGND